MARKALIVWGGWDGHEPENVAGLFDEILEAEGFETQVHSSLDAFCDYDLTQLSLIVPIWTMGTISQEQLNPVLTAVRDNGVGIAGCHGGMCDAFRAETEWQFMTGGQWVAHPGDDRVEYVVHIDPSNPHEITAGLPDFTVRSEQYYLHTDPGNNVLAYTHFPNRGAMSDERLAIGDGNPIANRQSPIAGPHEGNPCRMPQVWTKMYGKGSVFYNALGHRRTDLESPEPREIMRRGFVWAAKL